MIKITMKALINILTGRGYIFAVERCPFFLDKTVYVFAVGNGYPISPSSFIYMGSEDDRREAMAHKAVSTYKILCYYDASQDTVISANDEIYQILRNKIQEFKEETAKLPETVPQL